MNKKLKKLSICKVYNINTAKTPPKHKQNTAKTQAKHSQNTTKNNNQQPITNYE
jgi:hypothetical protein